MHLDENVAGGSAAMLDSCLNVREVRGVRH
jgi:hypothetical protein